METGILLYGILIILIVMTIYGIVSSVNNIQETNLILAELESQSNETELPTTTPTTTPTFPATPPPTEAPITLPPISSGETHPPTTPPTLPPLEYRAPYCGTNTIYNDELKKCVYYAENGSNSLSKLFESVKNKIIFVNNTLKVIDKPIANIPAINKEKPKWFESWDSLGRFNASNVLSGANLWGEGVNCSCGDCAAWRGGNAGTCVGNNAKGRGRNNQRRVACDSEYSPDRCVCAYPYTPVGGICVIPYKFDPTVDHRPCCSSCVYNESCVGKEECKGICEEQLVEYPGVRYTCDWSKVNLIDNETENITQADFDQYCKLDNEYQGKNEYQCAYECTATQIECSKRCLPKLWEWKKLIIGGEIKGVAQTPTIIQFEPPGVKIDYCPLGDTECQSNRSITEDEIQNCENCTDCSWELNNITNEYEYSCNNCENCFVNKSTGIDENGFRIFEKVKCSNPSGCRGCTELFDFTKSRNTITCNFCIPSSDSCIIYEIPNIQSQDTNNLKPYNNGESYNPSKNILWEDWYKGSDFGTGLACSINGRTSACDTEKVNIDGKMYKGYLEGGALGWLDVYNDDCRDRKNCSVPIPHFTADESLCYSAKYYGQMSKDVNCQKLPLPSPPPSLDNNLSIKKIVKEGVSKGLSKDECKKYFCNEWNWKNNEWTPFDGDNCNTLCEPDLFKGYSNIPEFATTNDQVTYLIKSGKNTTCFGGRNISEISGDCGGINSFPKPPPGVSSIKNCNSQLGDCDKKNCELYAGGILNTCNEDGNNEVSFGDYPQRQTCINGKCECKENTCPQSGLCLDQSDSKIIDYGLAKGLPEWQCPYYYCQFYNRETEEWEGPTTSFGFKACSAMCLPELYKEHKNIPDSVKTTQDQVLFLNNIIQPNHHESICKGEDTGEDTGDICSIM